MTQLSFWLKRLALFVGFSLLLSCGVGRIEFSLPVRLSYESIKSSDADRIRESLSKLEYLVGFPLVHYESKHTLHFSAMTFEGPTLARGGHNDSGAIIMLAERVIETYAQQAPLVATVAVAAAELDIDFFDLVVWHEFGHTLHFDHNENQRSLMYKKRNIINARGIDIATFVARVKAMDGESISLKTSAWLDL